MGADAKCRYRLAFALDRLFQQNSAESGSRMCDTNNGQVVGWGGGAVSRVGRILFVDFRFLGSHCNDLRLKLALLLFHNVLDFYFCSAPSH